MGKRELVALLSFDHTHYFRCPLHKFFFSIYKGIKGLKAQNCLSRC